MASPRMSPSTSCSSSCSWHRHCAVFPEVCKEPELEAQTFLNRRNTLSLNKTLTSLPEVFHFLTRLQHMRFVKRKRRRPKQVMPRLPWH